MMLLEGLEEEPISLEEIDRRLDEMRSGNAEMISLEVGTTQTHASRIEIAE